MQIIEHLKHFPLVILITLWNQSLMLLWNSWFIGSFNLLVAAQEPTVPSACLWGDALTCRAGPGWRLWAGVGLGPHRAGRAFWGGLCKMGMSDTSQLPSGFLPHRFLLLLFFRHWLIFPLYLEFLLFHYLKTTPFYYGWCLFLPKHLVQ